MFHVLLQVLFKVHKIVNTIVWRDDYIVVSSYKMFVFQYFHPNGVGTMELIVRDHISNHHVQSSEEYTNGTNGSISGVWNVSEEET